MGHQNALRRSGHHHQPLQARKRPQGHRRRQAGPPERLPQMPALRGERGLCGPDEPPRPRESPHHPADHQRQRVESAIQPLRLLQRALHRVQQPAHPHEDRAGHLPQAAGLRGAVPTLLRGQQRRPAHRGRLHPEPRPLPGRPLRVRHGQSSHREELDLPRLRGCRSRHRPLAHELHPPDLRGRWPSGGPGGQDPDRMARLHRRSLLHLR